VDSGQILVLTLESNPTTGFRWEVVEAKDSVLRQRGEAEFRVVSECRSHRCARSRDRVGRRPRLYVSARLNLSAASTSASLPSLSCPMAPTSDSPRGSRKREAEPDCWMVAS
jgi:hypothetical protein